MQENDDAQCENEVRVESFAQPDNYFVDPAVGSPHEGIDLRPIDKMIEAFVCHVYSPVEHWYRMQILQIPDPIARGRVRDDIGGQLHFALNTFLSHSTNAYGNSVAVFVPDTDESWIDAGERTENFGLLDLSAYERYYYRTNGWEPTVYRLPKSAPNPAPPEAEEYIKELLTWTIYRKLDNLARAKTAGPGVPPNYAAARPVYDPDLLARIEAMQLAVGKALLYGAFRLMEQRVFAVLLGGENFLSLCPEPSKHLDGWIEFYMPDIVRQLVDAGIETPLPEAPSPDTRSVWHPLVRRSFRPLLLAMGDYDWKYVEPQAQRRLFERDLIFFEHRVDEVAPTLRTARRFALCAAALRGRFVRLWTSPEYEQLWGETLELLARRADDGKDATDEDLPEIPTKDMDPLSRYGYESLQALNEITTYWEHPPEEQIVRAASDAVDFWLGTFSPEAVLCARCKKIPATTRMQFEYFPYGSAREPLFGTLHRLLDHLAGEPGPRQERQLAATLQAFEDWYAPMTKLMHELSGRELGFISGQTVRVVELHGDEKRANLRAVWRALFKDGGFGNSLLQLLDDAQKADPVFYHWKDFSYFVRFGWEAAPDSFWYFLRGRIAFVTQYANEQNPYLTTTKLEVSALSEEEFYVFLIEKSNEAKAALPGYETEIDSVVDYAIQTFHRCTA